MFHTLRAALIAVLVAWLARPGVARATGTFSPPLTLAPIALAATGPRLAIIIVPLDPKARAHTGALEQTAETAAARSTRFTLVPVQDALNPTAAKARRALLELGRQKVAQGRQFLDELDNVKATEALTEALDALKQADLTTAFSELTDAWVLKAASHATGGENGPAKKELEAIVSLNQQIEVSPARFPPDLIKYAEAQRKLANAAKDELVLRTTPTGARVWVDGAYQGIAPVTVAGLTPGKHLVSAVAQGSALTQAELAPGDNQLTLPPAELAAPLKQALSQATSDPEGSGRDQAAVALAKAMGVEQVLLVLARKSTAGEQLDLTALRVEARDGHNAAFRSTTLPPGKASELEQFFDGMFARDTPRDGKSPVTHFKGGGPGMRTLAAYSLLGVGAAGLITGSVFGFMALDRSQAFKETRQTEVAKSLQLKTQGQAFAVVADVSFLIALASAATGTVLLFTHPQPAQETSAPAKRADETPPPRREADDKRRAEEKRNEEQRRAQERQREDDKRRADEEEARKKADEEHKAAVAAEEKRKRDEERSAASEPKKSKKKSAAEKRAEEEARKKLEEETRRQEEEAARKKADEDRKRIEEEKRKKAEEKTKEEDHDDLKNY